MNKYQDFRFRNIDESPDYFLWQVFSQWQKRKNKLIAELDLTSAQMNVLTTIYWLKQNGKDTIQAIISDYANMDRMTTSQVIRTLQKKGLVLRQEHPIDTRAKTVELTEIGQSIVVQALKIVDTNNQDYFSILGDSKKTFIDLLKKLLKINSMQKGHISEYKAKINASIDRVWDALTKPELVKKYLFGSNLKTSWIVGEEISWTGEFNGQAFEDKGVILEFEPHKRLVYSYLSSWAGLKDTPENYLFVKNEVTEKDGVTELTITQSNYDEENVTHSKKNWEVVVNEIKKMLE